jgi:pyridinium-3,5-bisthiocarboxylic acid mononucleotide nickel chelatase
VRVAYIDMIGGAAGDMLLAAFLDAGLDRDALERALRTVVADGWTLTPQRVVKRGIAATFAGLVVPGEDGDAEHHHHHAHSDSGGTRALADVLEIVGRSGLTERARERASAVYRRLAEAEAHTLGTTADAIRFHEIGQIDAILDVAATCVALELLEIDELRCSPFPIGHGSIGMEHGLYPNPPPATAHLLIGWPTRALDVAGELVTPTAAAILTTLAKPGRMDMTIERIGYGAGRSDFPVPNITRVVVGCAQPAAWHGPPIDEEAVTNAMLSETTTIGVRARRERRHVLPRSSATVDTPYGAVRVKRAALRQAQGDADGTMRITPEYDDLLRIARETRLPLPEIARAVDAAIEGEASSGP